MPPISTTHLVLIPSYNSGPKLPAVVAAALEQWAPVWVVIDGSTDDSDQLLEPLLAEHPHLTLWRHEHNRGKGNAIETALRHAREQGYTHALCMDSDGQHPAAHIEPFMQISREHPEAMVLGIPQFDSHAPRLRVYGRRASNLLARILSGGGQIDDALFGFRLYPIEPLLAVFAETRFARRFDFEPEAAVRLAWRAVPAINRPVPVQYFTPEQGGISHFHYLRDNLRLAWMNIRLFLGLLWRLPRILTRKFPHDKSSGNKL